VPFAVCEGIVQREPVFPHCPNKFLFSQQTSSEGSSKAFFSQRTSSKGSSQAAISLLQWASAFRKEYIFNYNKYFMNTRTRVSTLPKQVISLSQQTSGKGSGKPAASCRENACFHTTRTNYKVRVSKLVVKAVVNQQHLAEKTRKRVSRLSKVRAGSQQTVSKS
jgi:hypothetical protein